MNPRTLRVGLILTVLFALLSPSALAQDSQQGRRDPVPFSVKKLTENVYWVEGGATYPVGNSGIIVGDKGVIVIDAKSTADSGKLLVAEIARITPKPITHVILTHSNGDHVMGLVSFPPGLTIIAHENNKKEQEDSLAKGGRGVPVDRLPNHLVKNKETLTINGVKLELLHWAPAHTSGDMVIYLPKEKIVFTGDLTAKTHPEPSLHSELHGSAKGWIECAKGISKLNASVFIPGHFGAQTKADVLEQLQFAEQRWRTISTMVKEGKSWEEIEKTAPEDKTLGNGRLGFTEIAYRELK